jgi:hypothetical protein
MEGLPLKLGVRVGVISDDLIYLRDDPGDSSSHIASLALLKKVGTMVPVRIAHHLLLAAALVA